MICISCSCRNDPDSFACGACGARLGASAGAPAHPSAGNGSVVHAGLPEDQIAEAELGRLPPRRASAAFKVDAYQVAFGPHGATIERRAELATAPLLQHPDGSGRYTASSIVVSPTEALTSAAAAVWAALRDKASSVRVDGRPGAGATTLLHLLSKRAHEHGYTDGALQLMDVIGPPADIARRLAARATAGLPQFSSAGSGVQAEPIHRSWRALILLDRAQLSSADLAELRRLLPSCGFVIVQPEELANTTAVKLGPLNPNEILSHLADVTRRPIDEDNAFVAGRLCKGVDMLPGPVRLIAVAAREMELSFISLYVAFEQGEAAIRELVLSRSPAERLVLASLAFAGAALGAEQIAAAIGDADVAGCLAPLTACELIGEHADGLYELPAYVAPHVTPLAGSDALFGRLADVFYAALDASSTTPLLDCQLHAAEVLLGRSFEHSDWARVVTLGLRLAGALARCGMFDAWGRVLSLVESAATRAGDAAALCHARQDLAVRAVILGECARAIAYLRSCVRDRTAAGDADGAAAATAVMAVANEARTLAEAAQAQSGHTIPAEPSSPTPSASQTPSARTQVDGTRPRRMQSDHAPRKRTRDSVPVRRAVTQRMLLLFACAIVVGAIFGFVRPRADALLAITHISTQPSTITAGASTRVCVEATNAAVVEVFPDGARLSGTGRNCVNLHPAITTTYTAVATSADGQQVRGLARVDVLSPPAAQPNIETFVAAPARVNVGQATRLCYAVTGASFLRMVPFAGSLTRLRSCETITLRAPNRYIYRLFATNEDGRVATRQVRVDVIVARHPPATMSTRHEIDGRLAQLAVQQFDAIQAAVAKPAATVAAKAIATALPRAVPAPAAAVTAIAVPTATAMPAAAATPIAEATPTEAATPTETADFAALSGAWEIDEANRWDGTTLWYGDAVLSSDGAIVLDAHKESVAGRRATKCQRRTGLHVEFAFDIAEQTVPYYEVNCKGATRAGQVRMMTFSLNDRSFSGSFWRGVVKLGDFNARKL